MADDSEWRALMNEIDALRAAIAGLSLAVPRWVEDIDGDDPVSLVLLLDDLRGLRQELAGVEAYAESQAARAMTTGKLMLPDGRVAERWSGSRKHWRNRELLAQLWDSAIDLAAGDLDDAIGAFRKSIVEAAGIAYWRVKPLRAAGLDPDDFCDAERGRATVRIPPKPPRPLLPEGGAADA